MRPTSDAFLRTLRGSHRVITRARVVETYQTGTDPDGTEIPIVAGDVALDASADVRATLDMTTVGDGMWPRHGNLLLAPYGNEVFVERGVQYSDDLVEYVALGYFRIQEPSQDDASHDGPIRLSGRDRMAGIIDARLLQPIQFDAGTTLGDVVDQLVTEVYPDALIEWDDATDTALLARSVICEEDRYGFLADLVRAQGKIFYWDHRGALVIKTAPDPGSPVWDVNAGAGGVLLGMSRTLSREGVYNAVVAQGEATDYELPVRAVAADLNPLSPTYFHGRFGPVPMFYTSSFLATVAQAQNTADEMLRRRLGLPYTVDLSAVPNPALEPYDPIRVRYSTRQAPETHIVDTLTIPLTAGAAMTGTTREQTVVMLGTA